MPFGRGVESGAGFARVSRRWVRLTAAVVEVALVVVVDFLVVVEAFEVVEAFVVVVAWGISISARKLRGFGKGKGNLGGCRRRRAGAIGRSVTHSVTLNFRKMGNQQHRKGKKEREEPTMISAFETDPALPPLVESSLQSQEPEHEVEPQRT